jgi:hypothetical protein
MRHDLSAEDLFARWIRRSLAAFRVLSDDQVMRGNPDLQAESESCYSMREVFCVSRMKI